MDKFKTFMLPTSGPPFAEQLVGAIAANPIVTVSPPSLSPDAYKVVILNEYGQIDSSMISGGGGGGGSTVFVNGVSVASPNFQNGDILFHISGSSVTATVAALATDTVPVATDTSHPTHAGQLLISQPGNASAAWADPLVQGLYPDGSPIEYATSPPEFLNPVYVGGKRGDNGNLYGLSLDPSGNLNVNVQVGGGGSSNVNISQFGGSSVSLGTQTAADSIPVALPTATITTLTPPSASAIGSAVATALTNPLPVTDSAAEGSLSTIAGAVSSSKMNVNISSGSIANTSFIATQATGSNLHTVVDSGSVTVSGTVAFSNTTIAVTQSTSPWVTADEHITANLNQDGSGNVGVNVENSVAVNAFITNASTTEGSPPTTGLDVHVNNASPIPVSGTFTSTPPTSTTGNSPANTAVTSGGGSILASNSSRVECTIVNTDVVVVYLGLGQVPTATAYHIALSPCATAHDGTGGTYTSDIWKGAINAIVASAGGHVAVTELT